MIIQIDDDEYKAIIQIGINKKCISSNDVIRRLLRVYNIYNGDMV